MFSYMFLAFLAIYHLPFVNKGYDLTMENDDIVATFCIIIIANAVKIIRKRQRLRRQWTRPWIQRRSQHGAHHALLQELTSDDPDGFRNFFESFVRDSSSFFGGIFNLIYFLCLCFINTCLLMRFIFFYFNLITLILIG